MWPFSKKPDPETPSGFADLFTRALRKTGLRDPIAFDEAGFRLKIGEDGMTSINLHNYFEEYRSATREGRAELMERWVRSATATDDLPGTFAEALPNLLPRIRERAFFEFSRFRPETAFLAESWRPVGEAFGVTVVYDRPETVQYVTRRQLEDWGVGFDQAVAAAVANLERRSGEPFERPVDGLHLSPYRDSFDATRAVSIDLIRGLKVEGDPVVAMPRPEILLVTGSEDEQSLVALARSLEKFLEPPRAMNGRLLRLEGREWTPWLPEPAHPAFPELARHALEAEGRDAEEQRELLQPTLGDGVFVAAFTAYQHRRTGALRSVATWSRGVPTLLPRVDEIVFVDPAAPEDLAVIVQAPWERVEEILPGVLRPEADLWPPRFRADGWPTLEQVRLLRE